MNKLLFDAQAVIFDVDGLMINSEPLWDRAREVFAAKYGKTIPRSMHDRFRGMGMKEIIRIYQEDLGIPGTIDDLVMEFRETFYHLALHSKELQLMEGAADLIRVLFNEGKTLSIATGGHTKEKMIKILQTFDLEKYFSLVVSSDEVKKGKPDPDIFLYSAQLLGIPKEHCVILEDAVNGVEAAKAAHMKVIAVQKDKLFAKKVQEFHPDVLVSNLGELL